jgi:hypothetical protein
MSKSITELMSSPDVGLPESVVDVCVAGKLALELQAATDALVEIETRIADIEAERDGESEGDSPKRRRMAVKPELLEKLEAAKAEAVEQADVCDEIRDRVSDHTVKVKVRGKGSGEWRRFCDDNPPRAKDDDAPGYARDLRLASLACNIDALAAAAGDWIVAYGDDDATPEAWEFVAANAVPSEMTKLAKAIADLHEGGINVGKSRRDWLATRRGETLSK